MRCPVGLPVALVFLLAAGCGGRSTEVPGPATAAAGGGSGARPLAWRTAVPWSREGSNLTVKLDGRGALVLDLSGLGVFDCRTDCFRDVGEALAPLGTGDVLCIGYLYVEEGRQAGKVWVNRYSCEPGGRVAPP